MGVNHREIKRKEGYTEWDVARTCWKCGRYGTETGVQNIGEGRKVHGFTCETKGCGNERTGWVVQTNRDGSIPDRTKGFRSMQDTEFQHDVAQRMANQGRRNLEILEAQIKESEAEEVE